MKLKPALALYQPDIAGNTGTLIRLSACLGTQLHIIAPAGFRHDDTALKRAGMDYLDLAAVVEHNSYEDFDEWRRQQNRRLILLTTRARTSHACFDFGARDILLLGRESSGVPETVRDSCDAAIRIPMAAGTRSLNQAVAGAMVLGEALRQTNDFAV